MLQMAPNFESVSLVEEDAATRREGCPKRIPPGNNTKTDATRNNNSEEEE